MHPLAGYSPVQRAQVKLVNLRQVVRTPGCPTVCAFVEQLFHPGLRGLSVVHERIAANFSDQVALQQHENLGQGPHGQYPFVPQGALLSCAELSVANLVRHHGDVMLYRDVEHEQGVVIRLSVQQVWHPPKLFHDPLQLRLAIGNLLQSEQRMS